MTHKYDWYDVDDDGSVSAIEKLFNDPRVAQLAALGSSLWYRAEFETGRVAWTAPLLQHWGYEPDDTTKHLNWWLDRTHPDDIVVIAGFLDQAATGLRERWALSYRFRKADGDWARVEGRAMLVRNPAGEPVATQGSVVEIARSEEFGGRW